MHSTIETDFLSSQSIWERTTRVPSSLMGYIVVMKQYIKCQESWLFSSHYRFSPQPTPVWMFIIIKWPFIELMLYLVNYQPVFPSAIHVGWLSICP